MQTIENSALNDDATDSPANHLIEEVMACWASGFGAYVSYLAALGLARTPAAVIDANMDFLEANLTLAGAATGSMLRRHGLTAPMLNDA